MRLPEPIRLAAAVVGVGALFLPWLTVRAYGPAALAGWCVHLVAGLLLVLALAPYADPATGGLPTLARAALSSAPAAAIRWYYVIGVTVGQVVVAAVGGAFVARAAGHPGLAAPAAFATLAVATALALMGREAPAWSVPAAFGAVVVCAVLAIRPVGLDLPDGAGGWPQAAAVMVFAFVGWETILRLHRPGVATVAAAVALVALVYAGAAVLAATAAPPAPPRAADGLAAAICLLACVRNLATVTRLAAGERGPAVRAATAAAAGVVTGGGLGLLTAGRIDLFDLLSVPSAMGLAVFLTGAAAAARLDRGRRRGARRIAAVVAAIWYAALLPFAGPAVAAPILVLAACAVVQLRGGNRAIDQLRLVRRVPGGRVGRGRDRVRPAGGAAPLDAAGGDPRASTGTSVVPALGPADRGHDRHPHPGPG